MDKRKEGGGLLNHVTPQGAGLAVVIVILEM